MRRRTHIRVGLSISLTGKYSLQGRQVLDGVRAWSAYVDSQGGLAVGSDPPLPIRIHYLDDESRVDVARQNAIQLLEKDRVHALLGPYSSGITLVVADVAEQRSRILWNHGGNSDAIYTRGLRSIVGIGSLASEYLRALPALLAQTAPAQRRICLLHSSAGTFAQQVSRGLQTEAARLGVHSVELLPVASPVERLDLVVSQLRDFSPDILVLASDFEDETNILRTRPIWPDCIQTVVAVAAGVHTFGAHLGGLAEEVIGPSQWEAGYEFSDCLGPTPNWFAAQFKERFGKLPEYTAAAAFATGLIFSECVRRAGSLEDRRLRDAASELDCCTMFGRFRIESRTGCQMGHRCLLVRWRQGKKVMLDAAGNEHPV
ncbi:MAG: ABC transporter substrate-binding protein [Terriglobales bacterium]